MPVRLNITLDEDIYRRLKKQVPAKKLSAFLSAAARAKLYPGRTALDAAYRAARKEAWRHQTAEDWRATETEEWPE